MSLRNFEGYTPPVRDDPDANLWIAARIEEAVTPTEVDAATIEGPFALSPPVTDPADPPTYDFSTTGAVLSQGWYRVVWIDDSGVEQATAWYHYRTLSPYAPSVGDIATLLRARAVEPGGWRVTSFTDRTNPTSQEVANQIALHTPLVFARLGRLDNLHCANAEDLLSAATVIAAHRVALEVEASYWPEEVVEAASIEQRRLQWDADITGLVTSLDACRASDDDGGNAGESESRTDPAWRYPPACPIRY